jgi:hypothetical protein
MALDCLLVPAMSIEAERLFSSCKITLSDRRNRVGAYLLEALECLKSWLKITKQEAAILEDLLDSLERGLLSKVYIDQEVGSDDEVGSKF